MSGPGGLVRVAPVRVRDPHVLELLDALTTELARGGYAEDETFGYSSEQLEQAGVHLVGARVGDRLVGVAGLEVADGVGELKRFFVRPEHRGTGVADALLAALVEHAGGLGVHVLRLETGDRQDAALAFYRRNGFVVVPRFGPYVDSATSVCMQRTARLLPADPAPPRAADG